MSHVWITPRVPGLRIRDCAGSCSVQRCTSVNATVVTAKTFFERLYLVPGPSPFEPRVHCPCAPTPPPFTHQLFLDFCAIFSPEWPLIFFFHHDSPSNLAESRYPRYATHVYESFHWLLRHTCIFYFSLRHTCIWDGMWHVECGMWNVHYSTHVYEIECGMRNVNFRALRSYTLIYTYMCDVECGMWSVECTFRALWLECTL